MAEHKKELQKSRLGRTELEVTCLGMGVHVLVEMM